MRPATARTSLPEWRAIVDHTRTLAPQHLRDLFAEDPSRADRFSFEACGLFVDHAKQRITAETLVRLLALAEACGLESRIDAMFSGARINTTEHRAVLHVALRAPAGERIMLDGHDVVPDVHEVLGRMGAFAERVRGGAWTGHTGRRIRTVVNIGIGGSDLGPVMANDALKSYATPDLAFRFVSNVDGSDFVEATAGLDRDARQRPLGPRLARGGTRHGGRRGEALRRRLDSRRRGVGFRHRHGEHVRLLGLGGRSLLDGLGDRPRDDACDRA
jgi:glucose-6-phosphate isomerase